MLGLLWFSKSLSYPEAQQYVSTSDALLEACDHRNGTLYPSSKKELWHWVRWMLFGKNILISYPTHPVHFTLSSVDHLSDPVPARAPIIIFSAVNLPGWFIHPHYEANPTPQTRIRTEMHIHTAHPVPLPTRPPRLPRAGQAP